MNLITHLTIDKIIPCQDALTMIRDKGVTINNPRESGEEAIFILEEDKDASGLFQIEKVHGPMRIDIPTWDWMQRIDRTATGTKISRYTIHSCPHLRGSQITLCKTICFRCRARKFMLHKKNGYCACKHEKIVGIYTNDIPFNVNKNCRLKHRLCNMTAQPITQETLNLLNE